MSQTEWKIKRKIPLSQVPAFLRSIADALEGRANDQWRRLTDLPVPITKLEIKGKAESETWKLKVKVETEARAVTPPVSMKVESPSTAGPSKSDYKRVKRQLKTAFDGIREAINAHRQPTPEVMRTFRTKTEEMMTFAGAAYGEPHYAVFKKACQQLVEAYEAGDWKALRTNFSALTQLKRDCHKAYK
jgi:XXXCH domain-containing protein